MVEWDVGQPEERVLGEVEEVLNQRIREFRFKLNGFFFGFALSSEMD